VEWEWVIFSEAFDVKGMEGGRRDFVTVLKIPRNEAAIALAQQIASNQRARRHGNSKGTRMARARFREAMLETHLKKAETKIVQEAAAIYVAERNALYEAATRAGRTPIRPGRYMVETIYERKQAKLNEMLVDDRRRPRCSRPTPLRIAEVEQNRSCSRDADPGVASENTSP
jgi:hypothetical protein